MLHEEDLPLTGTTTTATGEISALTDVVEGQTESAEGISTATRTATAATTTTTVLFAHLTRSHLVPAWSQWSALYSLHRVALIVGVWRTSTQNNLLGYTRASMTSAL